MERRTLILLLIFVVLSSCGSFRRTKNLNISTDSERVEHVSSSVSDSKVKVDTKSTETEKVSEIEGNTKNTIRDIFFDEEGRVTKISEVIQEISSRERSEDKTKGVDIALEEAKSQVMTEEGVSETKSSVKVKTTDTEREESVISNYIGGGILLLFVAVAVILWVRSRRW